jgi:ornithine carbamoyltransferase
MCHSYIDAAMRLDFTVNIACPAGYEPSAELVAQAGNQVRIFSNPLAAAKNADLVVTDVWVSMGEEQEQEQRNHDFKDYQVNQAVMNQANPDALFMHCLPAHRGEEVTAEVIDGKQSVVFPEAENRLHIQKALLEFLICT